MAISTSRSSRPRSTAAAAAQKPRTRSKTSPARPSRANAAATSADRALISTSRTVNPSSVTRAQTHIPDEGEPTLLRHAISHIFSEAQQGTATQRKLAVKLRKIQVACCYEQEGEDDGEGGGGAERHTPLDEFDEQQFNHEIGRAVLRIMAVKKSEPVGDRLVRFLTLFLKFASEKDNAIAQEENVDQDEDDVGETPSSRLVSHILEISLSLLHAKDKVVRFRSTQMIAQIVNTVDSIDDLLFKHIRLGLLRRLRDKESSVRVQAVLGLGRLADEPDEEDDEDGGDSDGAGRNILTRLLDILQNDPSAEVRRALLLNLPFASSTLPYLLERARDVDNPTRRALYSRLLPAIGDFRHLSLTHREKVLRWGLRDRDELVRKAASKLFREKWIEDCAGNTGGPTNGSGIAEAAEPRLEALLELLERIDVINAGVDGGVAVDAMSQFWEGRTDYLDAIEFPSSFWDQLTPESAFVARTFNEYCRRSSDRRVQSLAEDRLPEVTRLAFVIKAHVAGLIKSVQQVAECERVGEDATEAEEDAVQREFCVEQMLHIALTLDYSDEIGRRQMFAVLRETLALPDLPEECTRLTVEVVRTICGTSKNAEREFCGVVLEAVAEVHDAISEFDEREGENELAEASFHTARSDMSENTDRRAGPGTGARPGVDEEEKAMREMVVNMKCLHIALCMLQNLQGDIENNAHLVTMLNTLVVPAVRSQEAPIRERGLECLGLCCLLSQAIASENISLFLRCFMKGHAALQLIAIHILSDILLTFPVLLEPTMHDRRKSLAAGDVSLVDPGANGSVDNPILRAVFKMYTRALRSAEPDVQFGAATAIAKLMLTSAVDDLDLLKQLTMLYFDPDTRSNPSLQQALAYFLPVYCRSDAAHGEQMAHLAVPMLRHMLDRADELDDDGDEEIVGPGVVIGQLVDWTDPRNLVNLGLRSSAAKKKDEARRSSGGAGEEGEEGEEESAPVSAHYLLAERILDRLLTPGSTKIEKRWLVSMLGKLYLSEPVSVVGAANASGGVVTEASALATAAALEEEQRRLHQTLDQSRELVEQLAEVFEMRGIETAWKNTLNKVQTGLEKVILRVEEKIRKVKIRRGEDAEGLRSGVGAEARADGEGDEGDEDDDGDGNEEEIDGEGEGADATMAFGDGSVLESSIIAPMTSLVISSTGLA